MRNGKEYGKGRVNRKNKARYWYKFKISIIIGNANGLNSPLKNFR